MNNTNLPTLFSLVAIVIAVIGIIGVAYTFEKLGGDIADNHSDLMDHDHGSTYNDSWIKDSFQHNAESRVLQLDAIGNNSLAIIDMQYQIEQAKLERAFLLKELDALKQSPPPAAPQTPTGSLQISVPSEVNCGVLIAINGQVIQNAPTKISIEGQGESRVFSTAVNEDGTVSSYFAMDCDWPNGEYMITMENSGKKTSTTFEMVE